MSLIVKSKTGKASQFRVDLNLVQSVLKYFEVKEMKRINRKLSDILMEPIKKVRNVK